MPAVSIKGLRKTYGDLVAVNDLDLEIKKGEFLGFLGPNGAGKTTTINIMTGLANKDKGEVRIFGHDVEKEYQQARRLTGLSPQEFNFDPLFSIRKLLRYQAGYYGVKRKEAYAKADELLKMFDLEKKSDVNFRKLSGGMKRRLSIARAMVHDPELIILDEPTAGLDVELRMELWDYIRKVNQEGKTILLTTHYIEEAQKLCSRIGIINKGRLIALEDKKKLMKDLSSRRMVIEAEKGLKSMPRGIAALSEETEICDGSIVIHLEQDSDVDAILQRVIKDIDVRDIRTERESLEDIFVRLIKNG